MNLLVVLFEQACFFGISFCRALLSVLEFYSVVTLFVQLRMGH